MEGLTLLRAGAGRWVLSFFCAQIKGNTIYCANAGDSRGVMCRGGKAINLSDDHKPMDPVEKARIEKANGFVEDKRWVINLLKARLLIRMQTNVCTFLHLNKFKARWKWVLRVDFCVGFKSQRALNL